VVRLGSRLSGQNGQETEWSPYPLWVLWGRESFVPCRKPKQDSPVVQSLAYSVLGLNYNLPLLATINQATIA